MNSNQNKQISRWRRFLCNIGWHRLELIYIEHTDEDDIWHQECPWCGEQGLALDDTLVKTKPKLGNSVGNSIKYSVQNYVWLSSTINIRNYIYINNYVREFVYTSVWRDVNTVWRDVNNSILVQER